jgi:hypothetical protein
MNNLVILRKRVEKDVVSLVTRTLRGKGILSVKEGQQVSPDEIIGEASTSSGFRTMNLSELLSVSPHEVGKYLVAKLNKRIFRGELLAFKKGWMLSSKKVITSPTDGVLDFFNQETGEVRIAFLPKKSKLPAGVYGLVEEVDKEKGQVKIKTLVSRIYGMLGSGRSRDGTLHILGKKDDLIAKSEVQKDYAGYILVGGSLFFKDTISAAISTGVSGIITGGIEAKDYRSMAGGRLIFPKKLDNDIGISLVVCEGFGSIPLGDDVFELLSEYEGKFVFMDGNKGIISLPSPHSSSLEKVKGTKLSGSQEPEPEGRIELRLGLKVRIIGNSYPGEQGKLVTVDQSQTLLPSGLRVQLATVETKRRKLQVPVANLEVIG